MAENEVVLSAPNDGGETTVTTAAAFCSLVYGHGYVPKDATIEDAYTRLVPQGVIAPQAADAPPSEG